MKEHPILFSAPMVRALLAGRKTQTRRAVKLNAAGRVEFVGRSWHCEDPDARLACPYGQPETRLWVRENFRLPSPRWDGPNLFPFPDDVSIRYEADAAIAGVAYRGEWGRCRPSIHLPRKLSRIDLEITSIRIERLQDISEADAIAEGVSVHPDHHGKPRSSIYSPVQSYGDLWESLNGAGAWAENPWVWVVEFRRLP